MSRRHQRNYTDENKDPINTNSREAQQFQNIFFRKPYTYCLKCLSSNKMKCQACLQKLVLKLDAINLKSEEPSKLQTQRDKLRLSTTKKKQIFEIRKNYDIYMEKSIQKRAFPQFENIYPTKNVNYTFKSPKQPRFQIWKKKSYERIKFALINNLLQGRSGF